MPSLHRQYLAGRHDQVWHTLRQLGSRARESTLRNDAEAVAREAMTRAARNVMTIIDRLGSQGYQFGDPHNEAGASTPHSPPDEHTPAFVSWLEDRFGPLPATARAWIEIVGDVSLLGTHPDWPADAIPDPLVVEVEYKAWPSAAADRNHARAFHEGEYESWLDAREQDGASDVGPFSIDVAPDALHKANISGGAPYGFLVPDECADGTFRFEDGLLIPFIEYLRLVFQCGGFPGIRRTDLGPDVWKAKRELAADLLSI